MPPPPTLCTSPSSLLEDDEEPFQLLPGHRANMALAVALRVAGCSDAELATWVDMDAAVAALRPTRAAAPPAGAEVDKGSSGAAGCSMAVAGGAQGGRDVPGGGAELGRSVKRARGNGGCSMAVAAGGSSLGVAASSLLEGVVDARGRGGGAGGGAKGGGRGRVETEDEGIRGPAMLPEAGSNGGMADHGAVGEGEEEEEEEEEEDSIHIVLQPPGSWTPSMAHLLLDAVSVRVGRYSHPSITPGNGQEPRGGRGRGRGRGGARGGAAAAGGGALCRGLAAELERLEQLLQAGGGSSRWVGGCGTEQLWGGVG